MRVTKKEWDARGGLRNSACYRIERNGRWYYYWRGEE